MKSKVIIIPRERHSISRKNISKNALKVLYRLNRAGYEAYLVGGGVRDMLLGKKPKDFDITTNATPEQIRKLFNNCRLVGRRFRLAHIVFSSEIIEVATFRGGQKNTSTNCNISRYKRYGMLLYDNTFGSIEEDAQRRDFTINSLYYNIKDFTVRDYVGGFKDLKDGLIRLIGNPEIRYYEDPVRMLRAIRFAAKLNMHISSETGKPIARLGALINNVPPARLFEESLKLLQTGYGLETYKLLCKYNLFKLLFPSITNFFSKNDNSLIQCIIIQVLKNTDIRIRNKMKVSPAFLFAAIFLYPLLEDIRYITQKKENTYFDAFMQATNTILNKACYTLAIPKHIITIIRDIWQLQLNMLRCQNEQVWQLIWHPRFRAAYDLLALQAEVEKNHDLQHLVQWWGKFKISTSYIQKIYLIN